MDFSALKHNTESILAVDPGKSGAAALLKPGGSLQIERDFKHYDDLVVRTRNLAERADQIVIENVHAMITDGVKSAFSFGRALGASEAAILIGQQNRFVCDPGLKPFPWVRVSPLRWQNFFRRVCYCPRPQPFDSRKIAAQVFPGYADLFHRVKDHNSADAALMLAWWMLNKNTDENKYDDPTPPDAQASASSHRQRLQSSQRHARAARHRAIAARAHSPTRTALGCPRATLRRDHCD